MSFSYTEVSADTVNSNRVYHTPKGDYPSITTILGNTKDKKDIQGLLKWKKRVGEEEAERIKTRSARNGTKVHKHLENHFGGKEVDLSEATKEEEQMFRLLRMTYENDITNVCGQEVCLWSDELKYAGRCDMVAEWRGELAIIDFKTSLKTKKKEWIKDYYLQALGYALAHDEMFGTQIRKAVILISVEDDLPQDFVIDFEEEDWMYEELGQRIVKYYRGKKK